MIGNGENQSIPRINRSVTANSGHFVDKLFGVKCPCVYSFLLAVQLIQSVTLL